MTTSQQAARQMDESSILMLREFAAQGVAKAVELLALIDSAEPAPAAEPEVHIRWRAARKRGDSFYAVKYSSAENGSRTLCGADPTDSDMGWGEARYPKNLAYVTCETCKQHRAAGRES